SDHSQAHDATSAHPRRGRSDLVHRRDSPRRVLRSVDRLRAVWIRQVNIKQLGRWQKSRAFRQILSKPVLAALGPIEKGVMFILRKMKFIMEKRLEKFEVNKGKTRERLQRNIWN